jgi:glycosyltransferase involved in cell wall biosynthesis
MGKLRVVHIITMLELGGAQQNTLYTLEHLNRECFEVFLVSGAGGLLSEDAARIRNLQSFFLPSLVREVKPARDIKALFKLWILLRRLQPQIVHTHSSKAGILGRWAAKLAGVPVIIHSIHGFGFHDRQNSYSKRLFVFLERLTSLITTRFIAVSRADIEKGRKEALFGSDRVSLIRSGIPLKEFADVHVEPSEKKVELGLKPDDPVVGMVACFKPQKAPVDFVEVANRVVKEVPEARFLLAGDGELRGEIEDRIRYFRLEDSVRLLGWRRDIASLIRSFNVLALTSLWEGLPRVFPQAMAAGIPIVATDVDGAKEAVEHGVTGYLVEPHDVQRMAEHIVRLLKDPRKAALMGQRAKERVGEFDSGKMVKQQEELYLQLVPQT